MFPAYITLFVHYVLSERMFEHCTRVLDIVQDECQSVFSIFHFSVPVQLLSYNGIPCYSYQLLYFVICWYTKIINTPRLVRYNIVSYCCYYRLLLILSWPIWQRQPLLQRFLLNISWSIWRKWVVSIFIGTTTIGTPLIIRKQSLNTVFLQYLCGC